MSILNVVVEPVLWNKPAESVSPTVLTRMSKTSMGIEANKPFLHIELKRTCIGNKRIKWGIEIMVILQNNP